MTTAGGTTYEYKVVSSRELAKLLVDLNQLGGKGWRVIHLVHSETDVVALLELAVPAATHDSSFG